MVRDILSDADSRMKKTIEALQHDLMSIRTGRASPALVERLTVEYYSVPTPLMQLATISASDAQTLAIRPYSAADIGTIERAIAMSDLGITPNNDGQVIRLSIPPLTEERRRDLTKMVQKRVEEAKVSVRNIRRDDINDLRELEREGMISEDELHGAQDEMQKKTDHYIKEVEDVGKEKNEEIMTI